MKKILFTILLLAAAINVHAYDFSAVCSTGQTLYYNITSDSTVAVTYPGSHGVGQLNNGYSLFTTDPYARYSDHGYNTIHGWHSEYRADYNYTRPGGTISIPEIVVYNDTTYYVTSISAYAFYNCTLLSR